MIGLDFIRKKEWKLLDRLSWPVLLVILLFLVVLGVDATYRAFHPRQKMVRILNEKGLAAAREYLGTRHRQELKELMDLYYHSSEHKRKDGIMCPYH